MGLFTKLVTLPLAPVWGVAWVAKRVAEYAEDEMYGEAGVRRRLLEIEAAHAAGELSDEERERQEREAIAGLVEHQGLGWQPDPAHGREERVDGED
jgi:hypothetical protein